MNRPYQTRDEVDESWLVQHSDNWGAETGSQGLGLGYLYSLATGGNVKRMLEIGVHYGGSTTAFLLAMSRKQGELISIDSNYDPAFVLPRNLAPYWHFMTGDSRLIAPSWDIPIDMLFIDGLHSHGAVTLELQSYGAWVKPNGLIVLDDVFPHHPGVLRAFEEDPRPKHYLPYGRPHSPHGGETRRYGIIRQPPEHYRGD